MQRLQSFWGPEVAHFGPLDGPLSMDLQIPFFRLKLGRTSTLSIVSFTYIRSADSDLQIYFQKFCVTNHCGLKLSVVGTKNISLNFIQKHKLTLKIGLNII